MSLIVPQNLVKTVKDALEAHGRLDKQSKIKIYQPTPEPSNQDTRPGPPRYTIPVLATDITPAAPLTTLKTSLLTTINLSELIPEIDLIAPTRQSPIPALQNISKTNPLTSTLSNFLTTLPDPPTASTTTNLLTSTRTYTIYPPLLLLPSQSTTPPWLTLPILPSDLPRLYHALCKNLKITHIAFNAPIPLHSTSQNLNIRRAPVSFTPLHGDFGPMVPATKKPEEQDFRDAFWCTVRQNGIFQTWPPSYVMFSRGNVSEKMRILKLPSLTKKELGREVGGTSAVDLYAGIGYFAFSYLKAGVGMVLCWEINGWSVEGLRRGARGNGWRVGDGRTGEVRNGEKVVVFEEDNAKAGDRVRTLRDRILPVRHVNCGLLPSSRGSWATAVQVLDPVEGGWIHAHENIGVEEIESRKFDIVEIFTELVLKDKGRGGLTVKCHRLERVKSYAPGVIHCVLDIYIPPIPANATPSQ